MTVQRRTVRREAPDGAAAAPGPVAHMRREAARVRVAGCVRAVPASWLE